MPQLFCNLHPLSTQNSAFATTSRWSLLATRFTVLLNSVQSMSLCSLELDVSAGASSAKNVAALDMLARVKAILMRRSLMNAGVHVGLLMVVPLTSNPTQISPGLPLAPSAPQTRYPSAEKSLMPDLSPSPAVRRRYNLSLRNFARSPEHNQPRPVP